MLNYQQIISFSLAINSKTVTSVSEAIQKLESYCAYQERCHIEVQEKLRGFAISSIDKERVIVHLIEHNYLNEERFASLFTISKFHQKKWGKIRIKNELKARKISDFLITKSLKEIPVEEYETTFEDLSEKHWETLPERDSSKKRKKFCDFLLRKGWESDKIYEKLKQLEKAI
jgi:regulatory protein